ncbi:discoidin domain-containing protein [Pseudoalteromonas fenneropenaei]|uniref:Discoidin domain-containing protein n=1 Tax=Pseudoalteromonas fenneropenaei TaxID=1737459 RepID=A0ABV7CI38_9GAMM
MNKAKLFRFAMPALFVATALAGCGGGDNDPQVNDVPVTPDTTVAELAGSAVKGTLSAADVTVTALNGSKLTLGANASTNQNGELFVELTGAPGFGINAIVKMTVTASSASSMLCDAAHCGSAMLGETISGEAVAGTALSTLGQLKVTYGSKADGNADSTLQANALTTLATQLVENAVAAGRNASTPELMALAQADMSALLLRAMGWQTNNTNVFTTQVVSADSFDNFITGTECTTDDNNVETCGNAMASDSVTKLSLLNAALANFAEGGSQAGMLQQAAANLSAALAEDGDALTALRTQLHEAIAAHPLTAELGLSADSIVDMKLPLFDEETTSGPLQEVTTTANLAGATITARNSISDAESPDKAFDSDNDTKWLDHNDWKGAPSEADPSWIQIDFTTAHAVNSVFITSANDAPERDPENFTIVASNDGGATWQLLSKVVGASFDARFERKEFSFANEQAYLSYRINISKNKNNDGLVQLSGIQMVGPKFASRDHTNFVAGTASARNSIGDGENQDKAFDNDPTTKWLDHNDWKGAPSETDPSWLQMDFTTPVAVNALAITSANDAPERDPENFNLQASNDGGATWLPLASWVGEAFDERAMRRTFALSNQLAYSSYRLNVTKNKNNDGLMQIAEVELLGPELAGLDHARVAGAVYSARFSISESEGAAQAFDGDVNTKWLDHNDWQGAPTATDPAWIQVDLPTPQAVNTLSITSANDAPERDPENFQLMASNDGETWAAVASWVGESFAERFKPRSFSFANSLAYSHYRLNISKNANNDGLVQIAEVGMVGPQYAAMDLTALVGTQFSARNSIGDAENQDKAFDNDTTTKWLDHNDWKGAPSEADPSWIQVDFTAAQVVSGLAITSANDAPERDPENFTLLGSNDDGVTWQVVSSWVGESWENRFERRAFEFRNGFAYRSYRLAISKNRNNDGLVQLSEIELIGLAQE